METSNHIRSMACYGFKVQLRLIVLQVINHKPSILPDVGARCRVSASLKLLLLVYIYYIYSYISWFLFLFLYQHVALLLTIHHQLFLPAGSSTFLTSVEEHGHRIYNCGLRGETGADGWFRRRGAGEINPRYVSQTHHALRIISK